MDDFFDKNWWLGLIIIIICCVGIFACIKNCVGSCIPDYIQRRNIHLYTDDVIRVEYDNQSGSYSNGVNICFFVINDDIYELENLEIKFIITRNLKKNRISKEVKIIKAYQTILGYTTLPLTLDVNNSRNVKYIEICNVYYNVVKE